MLSIKTSSHRSDVAAVIASATNPACVRAWGLGRVAIRIVRASLCWADIASVQVEEIPQRICETFTLRSAGVLLQPNRRLMKQFRGDSTRE